MNVRILVTVSRSYREFSTMREVLTEVYSRHPEAILEHGDCEDGDRDAAGMWRGLGGVDKAYPADWDHCSIDCPQMPHRKIRRKTGESYCPGAGMRRNTERVESAPDLVLAFLDPKSRTKGAFRTAQMAEDAGIPTVRYEQGVSS